MQRAFDGHLNQTLEATPVSSVKFEVSVEFEVSDSILAEVMRCYPDSLLSVLRSSFPNAAIGVTAGNCRRTGKVQVQAPVDLFRMLGPEYLPPHFVDVSRFASAEPEQLAVSDPLQAHSHLVEGLRKLRNFNPPLRSNPEIVHPEEYERRTGIDIRDTEHMFQPEYEAGEAVE